MVLFLIAIFLWLTMVTVSIYGTPEGANISFDKRSLDEDPQEVFNKMLAFTSNTMRNDGGVGTSGMLPGILFPNTSTYPVPIIQDGVHAASHHLINNGFFTPPLPKDQFNFPFADKPTLRGSSSENASPNKLPVPPPVIPKVAEKDRVPIKRPDLVTHSDTKKKTINTPSVQKLPEGLIYSDPSSTTRINDTFEVVVPVVHNISLTSILRILNNGNKYDYAGGNNKPRLEPELKTEIYTDKMVKKFSTPTSIFPSTSVKAVYEEEKHKELPPLFVYPGNDVQRNKNEEVVMKEHQVTKGKNDFNPAVHLERSTRYMLGIAWDIHVYLIAVLFAGLVLISGYSLLRIRAYQWLLPYSYFFAVHSSLMTIGAVRSIYLFCDAYNISRSFSKPVNRLMMNVVSPFLVCIFSLMFLFILKIFDQKADLYYGRKSNIFLLFVIVYMLCSVFIDLYADDLMPHSSNLIFLSQCLFLFVSVLLAVAYLVFYKYANRSSLRKQNSVYGMAFTDPLRPSLAQAIRLMFATSLLSVLMAATQLIGMVCVYYPFNKSQVHPWMFWAFELSVRVIEVSICFLIFWAAVQPLRTGDERVTPGHNSAEFPSFLLGTCDAQAGSDHDNGNIYPTICNANQTIHNYTMRTGKQVYKEVFQCYNASSPSIAHTTDRRSSERHQLDMDPVRSACGTLSGYPERRPQPLPSILINEEGIVRFHSFADVKLHHTEDPSSWIHLRHPSDNYRSSS